MLAAASAAVADVVVVLQAVFVFSELLEVSCQMPSEAIASRHSGWSGRAPPRRPSDAASKHCDRVLELSS